MPHLWFYTGFRTSNRLPLMMLIVALPLTSAGNKLVFTEQAVEYLHPLQFLNFINYYRSQKLTEKNPLLLS